MSFRPVAIVVAQNPEHGVMIVQSQHRSLEVALRHAERCNRLASWSAGREERPVRLLYGAFALKGRLDDHVVAVGEVVESNDLVWLRDPDASCSECCDNCRPSSLTYCCPLLRGSPLCAAAARATPGRIPLPLVEKIQPRRI